MQLVISPDGDVRSVYGEDIDLSTLGTVSIQRGSHVETDAQNQWWIDLSPVGGPRIGPFPFACRNHALDAERQWLESHWLTTVPDSAAG
jgi:hypothetical protein